MGTIGQIAYEESDSDDMGVQLGDDYFHAGESGSLGSKEYERVTPSRFSADSDDIFMRSMIQQYALEAKGPKDAPNEGEPTGHFWMNEATTRAAAPKSSPHTRDSPEPLLQATSTPTSQEPGPTSMSTEPDS